MIVDVICPHCQVNTEIDLNGGANVFDCQHCGNAFTYSYQAPQIPPAPPPQIGQVNISHSIKKVKFWSVFRIILFLVVSIILVFVLLLVVLAFTSGFTTAFFAARNKAKESILNRESTNWYGVKLREADLKTIPGGLEKKYDEFESKWEVGGWFDFDKDCLRLYIEKKKGSSQRLRLFANRAGDWVFPNKLLLAIDDKVYNVKNVFFFQNRFDSKRVEYAEADITDDGNLVSALAAATKAKIRFSGREANSDFETSHTDMNHAHQAITAFLAISQGLLSKDLHEFPDEKK